MKYVTAAFAIRKNHMFFGGREEEEAGRSKFVMSGTYSPFGAAMIVFFGGYPPGSGRVRKMWDPPLGVGGCSEKLGT